MKSDNQKKSKNIIKVALVAVLLVCFSLVLYSHIFPVNFISDYHCKIGVGSEVVNYSYNFNIDNICTITTDVAGKKTTNKYLYLRKNNYVFITSSQTESLNDLINIVDSLDEDNYENFGYKINQFKLDGKYSLNININATNVISIVIASINAGIMIADSVVLILILTNKIVINKKEKNKN